MYQTKRFGLVASKQEYMMLCRAERQRFDSLFEDFDYSTNTMEI